MAKKVVASLKKADSKNLVKVVKMTRSDKSGAYNFKEDIIGKEFTGEFFKKNRSNELIARIKLSFKEGFFYLNLSL
jgi:hypothetical protein